MERYWTLARRCRKPINPLGPFPGTRIQRLRLDARQAADPVDYQVVAAAVAEWLRYRQSLGTGSKNKRQFAQVSQFFAVHSARGIRQPLGGMLRGVAKSRFIVFFIHAMDFAHANGMSFISPWCSDFDY